MRTSRQLILETSKEPGQAQLYSFNKTECLFQLNSKSFAYQKNDIEKQ
jgi:hypothetical protein